MSQEPTTNGVAPPASTKMSNLALNEYNTPTPAHDQEKHTGLKPDWGIPESFILPNGYPDVSRANCA